MSPALRPEPVEFVTRAPLVLAFDALVDAPRGEVFSAVVADPSTWTWFPGITRGSYPDGPPLGVGSPRQVTVGGATYLETVVAWDDPVRWAYRVDATGAPIARALVEEWTFGDDELRPGRTEVRWTFALDPSPLFRAVRFAAPAVMGPLFRRAMTNLEARLRPAGTGRPDTDPATSRA